MDVGGSLDGWGSAGYDGCEILTGPDFEDVFYKHNWASNAKLLNYYMLFGSASQFFVSVVTFLIHM